LRAQREPQRRQSDEGEGRGGAQIRRRAGHRPQQRPAAAHRDQQRRQQRRRARMARDQRPMARSRPGAEPPARPRAEPRPEQPREQRPADEKLVAANATSSSRINSTCATTEVMPNARYENASAFFTPPS
jgi:hypothetical protein